MIIAKIKIVTDSTADIPAELLKENEISLIPLKVIFGENSYLENIEIQPQEFYEKLVSFEGIPTTSQPSPGEFYDCYQALTDDGSTVISLHLSSLMSGTIQSARIAADLLKERDITIIDSKLVSYALGCVVVVAAKAAKAGKSKAEILDIIQKMIDNTQTYFIVDTLEYLKKNGRIGKASSLVGTMLNIKPVLTISDGQIAPFEKVRGKTKALELIIKTAKEYQEEHGEINCFVFYANNYPQALEFQQRLMSELNSEEILTGQIGAVVGTHGGPSMLALYFYKKALAE